MRRTAPSAAPVTALAQGNALGSLPKKFQALKGQKNRSRSLVTGAAKE